MRTHRVTWNKEDKTLAHQLKEQVLASYDHLTTHTRYQFVTKAKRNHHKTPSDVAKEVLCFGVVVEVHNECHNKELRIVVRHQTDVFVFNLSGVGVTYWENNVNDNHSTLRHEALTHDSLAEAMKGV